MPAPIVKIINKTRNTTLADKAQRADSFFSRLKGLLGRQGLNEGEGLVITRCSSIHTFFMRFKIDVAFLDRHNRVIVMANSLPPARLVATMFRGKLAIELPPGILSQTHTQKGDEIAIETT
jgi:uncharacterized membrane protein (UPF0127 family)